MVSFGYAVLISYRTSQNKLPLMFWLLIQLKCNPSELESSKPYQQFWVLNNFWLIKRSYLYWITEQSNIIRFMSRIKASIITSKALWNLPLKYTFILIKLFLILFPLLCSLPVYPQLADMSNTASSPCLSRQGFTLCPDPALQGCNGFYN